MTEHTISADEVDDLLAKLDALDVNDAQRALLVAVFKVAVDVQEGNRGDERPFSEQFAAAFKSSQADRVLAYAEVAPPRNPGTDSIIRSTGPSASTTAAAIIRGIIRDSTEGIIRPTPEGIIRKPAEGIIRNQPPAPDPAPAPSPDPAPNPAPDPEPPHEGGGSPDNPDHHG
jgi:hypothetical protein